MGWILYTYCLLVLSIQWIFRNRELDLLCMPMHRIGCFHFSLTCHSFCYSCSLYPSSAIIFSPCTIHFRSCDSSVGSRCAFVAAAIVAAMTDSASDSEARIQRMKETIMKRREETRRRTADEDSLRQKKADMNEASNKFFEEIMTLGMPKWLEQQKEQREEAEWRAGGGIGDWKQEQKRRQQAFREKQIKDHREVRQGMIEWWLDEEEINHVEKNQQILDMMRKKPRRSAPSPGAGATQSCR